MLHARRSFSRARMWLPGCQQHALDRIGQTLVAEDRDLGLRFAFFTRLHRNEAIPLIEQVPDRMQRFVRRAVLLPLLAISLAALIAATWLMPRQKCAVAPSAAAHTLSSLTYAAHCRPGPAIKLHTTSMH